MCGQEMSEKDDTGELILVLICFVLDVVRGR